MLGGPPGRRGAMRSSAWSPLAGGVLSGKYTSGSDVPAGTRLDPASLDARQRAVAEAVQQVVNDLDASPPQVAVAWTRRESSAIHPIHGARRVEQLMDNLGALELELPEPAVTRLDEAAPPFAPGFPTNLIDETSEWNFGAARLR